MSPFTVVIGASAGGLHALQKVVAQLPEDLNASVLVVLHTHPSSPGLLARALGSCGDIPVSYATEGEPILKGRVYLAPADRHLLVEEGDRMGVFRGPKENRHRPAVDPLFRSAAVRHGSRVIAVVLTGYLNDGTLGARAVKECGGRVIVQDPATAEVPEMPESVMGHVKVDYCLPLEEIAPLIVRLIAEADAGERPPVAPSKSLEIEATIPAMKHQDSKTIDGFGSRTTLTCPECNGTLWEIDDRVLRYRCHVGHAYTAAYLEADQADAVEKNLYVALKSISESATLAMRLATRAQEEAQEEKARAFRERARKLEALADTVRHVLAEDVPGTPAMMMQAGGEEEG